MSDRWLYGWAVGYGPTFVAAGGADLLGLAGVVTVGAATEDPRPADTPA